MKIKGEEINLTYFLFKLINQYELPSDALGKPIY